MDKQLLLEVEQLRDKMVETALVKQTFLNCEVLQLSQSLDELIVRVQEKQRELSLAR
ncbi:MAG: aspartyl-phosphate phosphatase Spo0E family protein [Candidatus Pristimantibacillus sp.]